MNTSPNSAIAPKTAAAAAEWFSLLQEDTVTERDFREWQQWLNFAPEHTRAYREIEEAWRLIGEVKPAPWATAAELGSGRQRRKLLSRGPLALAAAVLLGIAVTLSVYVTQRNPALSTRTAEQRSVRLGDGSRVTLGAQSRITPLFDGQSRRVELNFGEAYFEVAQDPRRPFKVIAGNSEIRAVGTAFNVRSAKDRVLVTVTEGRVAVVSTAIVTTDRAASVEKHARSVELLLAAGEQAAVTRTGVRKEAGSAAATATTWLQGRFEYRGEELRHVIDDINRYADRPVVLTDESLAVLRYSGTVFPDHLDEWLQGISGVLPVTVNHSAGQREISPSR